VLRSVFIAVSAKNVGTTETSILIYTRSDDDKCKH